MTLYAIEEWKPIDGFPSYEVSSHGRVRHHFLRGPKVLKPWPHRSGHLYVSLGRGNKRQIHRLVLVAFVGPQPSPWHESRHRDGDPTNNRADNLLWGTRLENVHDTLRHWSGHPNAITTTTVAAEIRARHTGRRGSIQALATEYGLSHSVASCIVNNKTYKAPV